MFWKCPNCAIVVPMEPHEFPITCRCGHVGTIEEVEEKLNNEDFRGPSLVRIGINFAKATVRDIRSGFKRVSEEVYNKRLEVCSTCSFVQMRVEPSNNPFVEDRKVPLRCKHKGCGCFLSLKAWRDVERCPIGKWNE